MFPCVGSEQGNLEVAQVKELKFHWKSREWGAELLLSPFGVCLGLADLEIKFCSGLENISVCSL